MGDTKAITLTNGTGTTTLVMGNSGTFDIDGSVEVNVPSVFANSATVTGSLQAGELIVAEGGEIAVYPPKGTTSGYTAATFAAVPPEGGSLTVPSKLVFGTVAADAVSTGTLSVDVITTGGLAFTAGGPSGSMPAAPARMYMDSGTFEVDTPVAHFEGLEARSVSIVQGGSLALYLPGDVDPPTLLQMVAPNTLKLTMTDAMTRRFDMTGIDVTMAGAAMSGNVAVTGDGKELSVQNLNIVDGGGITMRPTTGSATAALSMTEPTTLALSITTEGETTPTVFDIGGLNLYTSGITTLEGAVNIEGDLQLSSSVNLPQLSVQNLNIVDGGGITMRPTTGSATAALSMTEPTTLALSITTEGETTPTAFDIGGLNLYTSGQTTLEGAVSIEGDLQLSSSVYLPQLSDVFVSHDAEETSLSAALGLT